MTQEEQGQPLVECSDANQRITGISNDTGTHIGGTSVEKAEKACWKADSVQSIVNRQSFQTEEEKRQFIHEIFQLDMNKILKADAKLKEAMIKLFLDNFEVLAMHSSQYGETEVLEMKIDLVPGVIPYKSGVRLLNPDQKNNLQAQINEWLEQGVIEPSVNPWASPLVPVKKKDGWTRWATDLRELNKQTIKDS